MPQTGVIIWKEEGTGVPGNNIGPFAGLQQLGQAKPAAPIEFLDRLRLVSEREVFIAAASEAMPAELRPLFSRSSV